VISIPKDAAPQDAFPLAVEFVDRFLAMDDSGCSPVEDEDTLIRLGARIYTTGGPMAAELCLGGILEVVLAYAAGSRKADVFAIAQRLRDAGHVEAADAVYREADELGANPLVLWQAARTELTELGLTGR
jgi:hypothetical protein